MNPVSRQSYIQVRLAKLKIVISPGMSDSGWRQAREKAGLTQVRVHDLKHTLGRRIRAAGVSFEDRQDLLGHRSGRMTTHYSAAELTRLIEAANTVCSRGDKKPELVVLRRLGVSQSRKTPAKNWKLKNQSVSC